MHLKSIELSGFKSFAKKSTLEFTSPIAGIVGPNGSGKSNTAEAFRFVLGEQSMKAMRGKRGPDMIWSGNDRQPQANRARVSVVFDNKTRLLDIDFDEVAVERVVHRDGANEYSINGSKVRLKDIGNLLASANVGASGHHIISQGEADRILGASEKDRREMIEEALGLKTFQYKKVESEKKLEKTTENMKEVGLLRRELAPHLTFLERQMKKLERAQELAGELVQKYSDYVAHERVFIANETARLRIEREQPEREQQEVQKALEREQATVAQGDSVDSTLNTKLTALDERVRAVAHQKSDLLQSRGRLEGQLLVVQKSVPNASGIEDVQVSLGAVETFLETVERDVNQAKLENDVALLTRVVQNIQTFIRQFKEPKTQVAPSVNSGTSIHALQAELTEVQEALAALESEEATIEKARADILTAITEQQQKERNAQRAYFELKDRKRTIVQVLDSLRRQEAELERTKQQLQSVQEHIAQSGYVLNTVDVVHSSQRSREEQREVYRTIERLEARLEETGGVDEDTIKEYEETKKRDAFLASELGDLEGSKSSLLEIIGSLESELATRFNEGLDKINSEFKKFFSMLFDGGDAQLHLALKKKRTEAEDGAEIEDTETKEGIEIRVQLPRKKVTTLDVLSGGERALTSIALIFAMSQVNPPPFIILDETDAALDEANSRKYADMVRVLSERSQLILITHNRQTMEATGELYGVTMGNDGISKVLSVKFDEAVSVAK